MKIIYMENMANWKLKKMMLKIGHTLYHERTIPSATEPQ